MDKKQNDKILVSVATYLAQEGCKNISYDKLKYLIEELENEV